MATDPDRQSNGDPQRPRRRSLSRLPGGMHGVSQVGWALAMAVALATRVSGLVDRPSPGTAVAIIEVTTIWAIGAGLAWVIRSLALTGCGRWGARTRRRVRQFGRG